MKSSEPEASSSPPPRSRSSAYRFAAAAAAAAASAGAAPRWSCAPVRSAASVESARQFTQWPWPSRVRTSFPSAAAHTLTVRSCEPVKRRPSPPPPHARHRVGVPRQREHRPPRRALPQPHRAVLGRRREAAARARRVAAVERLPRERVDELLVRADRPLRRRQVGRRPHRHRAVLAAGEQIAAARRPRDREHPVGVRAQRRLRRLGEHVPQPDGVVARARREQLAARRELRRDDRARVARQRRRAARDGAHAEDGLRHVHDAHRLLGRRAADRRGERRGHLLLRHVEGVRDRLVVAQQLVHDHRELRWRCPERHVGCGPVRSPSCVSNCAITEPVALMLLSSWH